MSFIGEPCGLEGPGHLPGDIGVESLPKGAVKISIKEYGYTLGGGGYEHR